MKVLLYWVCPIYSVSCTFVYNYIDNNGSSEPRSGERKCNTNVIIVKHAIKFLISDCKIKLLHSLLYAVAIWHYYNTLHDSLIL